MVTAQCDPPGRAHGPRESAGRQARASSTAASSFPVTRLFYEALSLQALDVLVRRIDPARRRKVAE